MIEESSIKEIYIRVYYLFIIPFKSTYLCLLSFFSLILLATSIIYTFGLNYIINSDILNVSDSDIEKIINWKPKKITSIYDSNGKVISELYSEDNRYVKYEDIPKHLVDAIISIEDQHFLSHDGVDVPGIIRAALMLFKDNKFKYRQGASTITQQVVRALLLSREKTLLRKAKEISLSLYLETKLSKKKIFEIYSNIMFMGNGAYGVRSASKRYFNKELVELDIHESALLAGLFQLPSYYNPSKHPKRALKRQRIVLRSMLKTQKISKREYKKHIDKELEYTPYVSAHGKIAPFFVDYIINKSKQILKDRNIELRSNGLKIFTTLNQSMQSFAEKSIKESSALFHFTKRHMMTKDSKDKVEAAILSVNHKSGEIVAMVGGRNHSENQFNRAISSRRAPGSLFKSITYSYALKNGQKWNDLHYISPLTVGNYRPHTSRHDLLTEITLLNAFSNSVNSVAVKLGVDAGVKRILRHAKKLGMKTKLRNEASTLLGASEVSMLDISNVYSTFANNGIRVDPIAIKMIKNSEGHIIYHAKSLRERSKRVLSNINSELIREGLKQVVKTGTAYRARSMSNLIGGKTGTSNLSKDNWFAGFSRNLTTVTWVGSDRPIGFSYKVSASTVAVPLWRKYMQPVVKLNGNIPLSKSRSLTQVKVNYNFGYLDEKGRAMYFSPYFLPTKKVNLDLEYLSKGKKLRLGL